MSYLPLLWLAPAVGAAYLIARFRSPKPAAPLPGSAASPVEPGAVGTVGSSAPIPTPIPISKPSGNTSLRPIVRAVQPQVAAMLRDFVLVRAADLPAQDSQAVAELLSRIPRPPSALHKLVSPDYLAQARTAELSEMVMAEPRVAAKVLAVVNSPLYGLKTPLASIAQAVTFLGMNTVRGICLQYLLDASFQTKDPQVRKIFQSLWNASAFASELCFKLAQMLELAEPGTLVTQVVLSFLGQVASHSLLPKSVVLTMQSKGILERSHVEQDELGLCAAELGALLMQQWQLPDSIIARVRAIDQVMLAPATPNADAAAWSNGLCYLCARLGEKLARGEIQDLASVRLDQEAGAELFYLGAHLPAGALERLGECLRRPELVQSINSMAQAMHARG